MTTLLDLACRELADAVERVAAAHKDYDLECIANDIRRPQYRMEGIEEASRYCGWYRKMGQVLWAARDILLAIDPGRVEKTDDSADTILCHALRLTVEPAYRADVAAEMWRALGGEG